MNETQQILNRLEVADRAHQKEVAGQFLLRCVKFICGFVLVAFVADLIFQLDAGWRLGILLSLIVACAVLAGFAWRLGFVRRNRLEHIARFLESRDDALGSKLINFLQLQRQADDQTLSPLTRELARRAVENYTFDLKEFPVEQLARTEQLRRQLVKASWAIFIFAAVLAAFFQISAIEIARFADPLGDHPPYSFTRLEILEPGAAGTNILFGKSLVVAAKASGHRPKEIFLTSFPPGHIDQATTLPMFDKGSAGYSQLIDDVRTDLLVYAHTKDDRSVSKQVRVGVILTPQLEKAFVKITPPAYTGLRPEEKNYEFKGVQVLEGSEVRFRLQSNRPLREGLMEISGGDASPQRITFTNTTENEVAGTFVAKESGRLRFSIIDTAGNPSTGDCEGALTVTYDLPPDVRIVEPENDAFVAEDFKLQVHVEANDDYGVRALRLHRGLNEQFSPPRVATNDAVVRDATEMEEFDFAKLGVKPGDVVSLFAEAVDTAPQPHIARSQTVHVQIISVEDYNNYLREQNDISDAKDKYDALTDNLQQLIDEQKKLGADVEKLKAQLANADATKREELARELDALLAKQNELNRQLNQQADNLEHFVRDHPLYDVEKDFQDLLNKQAAAIRDSTSTNDATARDIAQRSAAQNGSRQLTPEMLDDLKRASDEQVAKLDGTQNDEGKKIADTLQDMSQMQELINDFNQFEALYQTQQQLAGQAQAYSRPGELSREGQLALKDMAATEHDVDGFLDELPKKLRDDAADAEKLFPKAAKSGRDLADQMEKLRLESLAHQATDKMLAADGEQSFAIADRLRTEMGKLFQECQGSGNCPSGNELDSYLTLQRGMNPGSSFAQMSRSRKFGHAGGQGFGLGEGESESDNGGSSGYAMSNGQHPNVLGNESKPGGNGSARQSSRFGHGAGNLAGNSGVAQTDKADSVKGLKPINRQSGAVSSEATIEEYNDVVDHYFETITTKKKQ